MGEVYRARDTRLRRDVALKILRESRAGDPRHEVRLLHEARAAGALNHPNIVVVYDVGTEESVPFVVSELVDGTTLRHVMSRGPMPIKALLEISVQIADGLAAAHDAGLVHRDLKPENVMVTSAGRVKILDFGIAKAERQDGGQAGRELIPTETANGLVSGTAAYMSPEQARGRHVDFRSDQFALGLMLYEMAAGARAFTRETPVQTLSAIIEDEPPPLTEVNPRIPAPLRWIIERCLAKDPRQRYAATADLAHDLRTLRDRLAEAGAAGISAVGTKRWSRTRLAIATAAISAAAGVGLLTGALLPSAPPVLPRFTPLANDFSYQGEPAWSSDGKMIAYAALKDGVLQIFKRSLDSSQSVPLTSSKFDCRSPFWAPDGSRVYYISQYGEKEGVWSVSAAAGQPEPVMPDAVAADLSPDGGTLAFLRDEGQDGGAALHLWMSSPPSGKPHRYVRGAFGDRVFSDGTIRFSADGSTLGLWVQNWSGFYGSGPRSALWLIPMSASDPRVTFTEVSGAPNYPPHFDWLSDGRRIVAAIEDGRSDRPHLWIGDTKGGTRTQLTSGAGSENMPVVSPDGRRIAYATQDANFDLFEIPIDGSPPKPLLATTRSEMEPSWSPVSDEFAFVSDSRGYSEIRRRSHDGSFDLPIVTVADFPNLRTTALRLPALSPDGRRVAFEVTNFDPPQHSGSAIWIATLGGGAPVSMTSAKGTNTSPTWAPNGDRIAMGLGTPDGWWLAVARVGAAAGPVVIGPKIWPFSHPQWSPDGRWIASNTPEGLTLITPDGKSSRVLDEDLWAVYGWAKDGSTVYGIKQDPADLHRMMLVSAEVESRRLRIINPDLAPLPPANQPVKGFTRMPNGNFATSLVHVRSDVWLIDDFDSPSTWLDRLRKGLR
jgi:serine/threonine protein kinase